MVLRLEALALQQYVELIKQLVFVEEPVIQRETSKATVEKIWSNFGEVKGLAAFVVNSIYSHSKNVAHWEIMKKILENSLQYCEAVIQKCYTLEKKSPEPLKESIIISKDQIQLQKLKLVIKSNSTETYLSVSPKQFKHNLVMNRFISQMLSEENQTVNPVEMMLIPLSLNNIKDACARVDSHAKDILNNCKYARTLSLRNEMLRIIEELGSLTTEIKSIQEIQMTVKKYLDTGPYKTWEEVQVDFLRYLIQQPGLHLFANELSESLMSHCIRQTEFNSLAEEKMMIEACIHPAVTKLNANDLPVDILLELLPRLKDLNTLKVKARINTNRIRAEDAEVFACMLKYCTKLKCLCVTFKLSSDFPRNLIPLDDVIAWLPSTLVSISFYGIKQTLNVKFLDKMAASVSLNSLNRLTLCRICPSYPLHQGFRSLVAVTVLNAQFGGSKLFRNVGRQLKELSLSSVFNIEFRILAECCPSLETLSLKHCTFSMSFHTEPVPAFSSLKEILFITPSHLFRQDYDAKNICIWCIVQNSPKIEKLVVVISVVKFVTCFLKLMKTNQMRHLQEFQLYKYDKYILQGLIEPDIAVQMINKLPALSFIGGIQDAIAQRNLSETYSNKTFVCIHEKILEYAHERQFRSELLYWSDADEDDDDGDDDDSY